MLDLLGIPEIARRYGVRRETVYEWLKRDDFPAPIVQLAAGRVWDGEEVEDWYRYDKEWWRTGTDTTKKGRWSDG